MWKYLSNKSGTLENDYNKKPIFRCLFKDAFQTINKKHFVEIHIADNENLDTLITIKYNINIHMSFEMTLVLAITYQETLCAHGKPYRSAATIQFEDWALGSEYRPEEPLL